MTKLNLSRENIVDLITGNSHLYIGCPGPVVPEQVEVPCVNCGAKVWITPAEVLRLTKPQIVLCVACHVNICDLSFGDVMSMII